MSIKQADKKISQAAWEYFSQRERPESAILEFLCGAIGHHTHFSLYRKSTRGERGEGKFSRNACWRSNFLWTIRSYANFCGIQCSTFLLLNRGSDLWLQIFESRSMLFYIVEYGTEIEGRNNFLKILHTFLRDWTNLIDNIVRRQFAYIN